jgi:hypothetical protein
MIGGPERWFGMPDASSLAHADRHISVSRSHDDGLTSCRRLAGTDHAAGHGSTGWPAPSAAAVQAPIMQPATARSVTGIDEPSATIAHRVLTAAGSRC